MTLLLSHTGRYLRGLSPRLKFLFVFCQLWYPLFAVNMALMYLMPIIALSFDVRFADVSYPAFIGHAFPTVLVLTIFAYQLRRDGFPPARRQGDRLGKGAFHLHPVALGVVGLHHGGARPDHRPLCRFPHHAQGSASASQRLPIRVLAVYVVLALGCIAPVLLAQGVTEARGFHLLSVFNALLYTSIVVVIVVHHPDREPDRLAQPEPRRGGPVGGRLRPFVVDGHGHLHARHGKLTCGVLGYLRFALRRLSI